MGCFYKTKLSSCLITIMVIIQTIAQVLNAEMTGPSRSGSVQGHCTTDDLNHSVLVECDDSNCKNTANAGAIWPEKGGEVIHMYSTRSGDRFVVDKLTDLNYWEPEQVRMFDINNTLYVRTMGGENKMMGSIRGFGTTINTGKLLAQMKDNSFDRNYEIIMRDLFGLPPFGNGFTILRLPITRAILIADRDNDVLNLISKIDSWALKMVYNVDPKTKIKIIISLEDIGEGGTGLNERLISLSQSFLNCQTCWALAVHGDTEFKNDVSQSIDLTSLIGTDNLFGAINSTDIKQNPSLLAAKPVSATSGILVNSEFSVNYNILDEIKKLYPQNMLTIGGYRQQVVEYGDWQNAKNYAVTILNNLKHGSNGFIEDMSNNDIMAEFEGQDSSIYNLRPEHSVHFKGPMYYAIGHFSRHLNEGSELLETSVTTAANMFGAHYGAFRVRDKGFVAIVLNDNEHLLPFRLAIDGRIRAFTNIKPKSFNTFVIDKYLG